ncbi:MAG: hypothetical protein OH338_04815 [Candidatus Parvarchaeota archaeon]|nr:hypothetical protein [Candidatus Parvarchaeum tengchongense]
MAIRHLRKLAILVKYNPRAMNFIEKKFKLREKYGNFVVFIFWDCLRDLEKVWGEPFFRKCLSDKFADLSLVAPEQKVLIEKFLKDLPKFQEDIREFLTEFFKEKAKREKIEMEFAKMKKEEEEKISDLLKEVL